MGSEQRFHPSFFQFNFLMFYVQNKMKNENFEVERNDRSIPRTVCLTLYGISLKCDVENSGE